MDPRRQHVQIAEQACASCSAVSFAQMIAIESAHSLRPAGSARLSKGTQDHAQLCRKGCPVLLVARCLSRAGYGGRTGPHRVCSHALIVLHRHSTCILSVAYTQSMMASSITWEHVRARTVTRLPSKTTSLVLHHERRKAIQFYCNIQNRLRRHRLRRI